MSSSAEKKLPLSRDIVLLKKIAALDIANTPDAKIAKELGISRFTVGRIKRSLPYHDVLDRLTDKAIAPVVANIRKSLGELADECIRVVKEKLESNSLEAVKIVFNAVGVSDPDSNKPADSNIQIILPGGMETVISSEVQDVDYADDQPSGT